MELSVCSSMTHTAAGIAVFQRGTRLPDWSTFGTSSNPTASLTIPQTQKDVLAMLCQYGVVTPKQSELRHYLAQFPDMNDVLPPVCKYARRIIGAEAQLSLEMFYDPESEDQYLTLYVRQPGYDDSLMERIEDISNYCESVLEDKSGWLVVTTDFAQPRSVHEL